MKKLQALSLILCSLSANALTTNDNKLDLALEKAGFAEIYGTGAVCLMLAYNNKSGSEIEVVFELTEGKEKESILNKAKKWANKSADYTIEMFKASGEGSDKKKMDSIPELANGHYLYSIPAEEKAKHGSNIGAFGENDCRTKILSAFAVERVVK